MKEDMLDMSNVRMLLKKENPIKLKKTEKKTPICWFHMAAGEFVCFSQLS